MQSRCRWCSRSGREKRRRTIVRKVFCDIYFLCVVLEWFYFTRETLSKTQCLMVKRKQWNQYVIVSNCFVSISWIEKKITKDVLTFFFLAPLQVLKSVLELLPNPALKRVTVNFEKAIWIVLRELLPNVEIQGCVFHQTQALWRKISNGTRKLVIIYHNITIGSNRSISLQQHHPLITKVRSK